MHHLLRTAAARAGASPSSSSSLVSSLGAAATSSRAYGGGSVGKLVRSSNPSLRAVVFGACAYPTPAARPAGQADARLDTAPL